MTISLVTKLSSSGGLVWARGFVKAGSSGSTFVRGVAIDGGGNVYATGTFTGATDFDPGAGEYILTPPASSMFVTRLTAAGNLDWAGSIVGAAGRNVAVDASGVLNVVGSYLNTVDFDPDVNETFKLTTPKQNGFRLRLRQS